MVDACYADCDKIVVTIICKDKAYVIHDPAFYYTAQEIEEELTKQGYDVFRLNTGNEIDAEAAERLLSKYC